MNNGTVILGIEITLGDGDSIKITLGKLRIVFQIFDINYVQNTSYSNIISKSHTHINHHPFDV